VSRIALPACACAKFVGVGEDRGLCNLFGGLIPQNVIVVHLAKAIVDDVGCLSRERHLLGLGCCGFLLSQVVIMSYIAPFFIRGCKR